MEKTTNNIYIIDHEGDDEVQFTVQRTISDDSTDEMICFTTKDEEKGESVLLLGMDEAKNLTNVLNHLIYGRPLVF